jgi:hypothetical protein
MLLGIRARGERSPDARRAKELGTLLDVGSLCESMRTKKLCKLRSDESGLKRAVDL